MAYDYELWLQRAKQNELTPFWIALSTLILAPLGYWLCGDGYKGLRYTVVIFFAGYVTLGVATIIGALILAVNVYLTSSRNEKRFSAEGKEIKRSGRGWIYKTILTGSLILLLAMGFLFTYLIMIAEP